MGWKSVLRGVGVAAKVYQLYQTSKQEKIRQAAQEERYLNNRITSGCAIASNWLILCFKGRCHLECEHLK